MTEKKRILLMSIMYPLTMTRYFETAFRNRDDVELTTVGPYTKNWIPWLNGIYLDEKYSNPPDVVLPFGHDVRRVPWPIVENLVGVGKEFDLIITGDANIHFTARPTVKCPIAHIGTDPHVLGSFYDEVRPWTDYFFNMQKVYSKPGDIYLPYAFNKYTFFNDKEVTPNQHHACMIGMPYDNRVRWVDRLRGKGIDVLFENGPIFGEYRRKQCSAPVGLSWSSMDDLICRVFELMGMGRIPVINRVTDLPEHFVEGVHYIGFDGKSLDNATEVAVEVCHNPEKYAHIAQAAEKLAWEKHTFDHRVDTIMKTVFGDGQ